MFSSPPPIKYLLSLAESEENSFRNFHGMGSTMNGTFAGGFYSPSMVAGTVPPPGAFFFGYPVANSPQSSPAPPTLSQSNAPPTLTPPYVSRQLLHQGAGFSLAPNNPNPNIDSPRFSLDWRQHQAYVNGAPYYYNNHQQLSPSLAGTTNSLSPQYQLLPYPQQQVSNFNPDPLATKKILQPSEEYLSVLSKYYPTKYSSE